MPALKAVAFKDTFLLYENPECKTVLRHYLHVFWHLNSWQTLSSLKKKMDTNYALWSQNNLFLDLFKLKALSHCCYICSRKLPRPGDILKGDGASKRYLQGPSTLVSKLLNSFISSHMDPYISRSLKNYTTKSLQILGIKPKQIIFIIPANKGWINITVGCSVMVCPRTFLPT